MAYEVTATKKRPQIFDELIGQEFVVTTLKNSITAGRIAHAYLFSGPRGVGKTSAARILAKALNCQHGPTDKPCGQCPSCQEISRGNSLDVIEIDGASNTSVNDVREIKDEVLFAPNASRYKIYIIDEVHMLSHSAFNALLKTIEEPPPYIVFIFATTEVHKVPATVRSRCQQYTFRLIAADLTKEMLRKVIDDLGLDAEDQALFWISKEATGSLRDAYTLLDQVISFSDKEITLDKIREKLGIVGIDQMNRMGEIIISGDKREILEYTEQLLNTGISVEQFVIDLTEYFRSLLFLKCGIRKESLLSFPAEAFPGEIIEFFSTNQLETAMEFFLTLHRHLKFSLNQRFELELTMHRLMDLKALITPAEVVQEIRKIKAEIDSSSYTGSVPEREGTDTQLQDTQLQDNSLQENLSQGNLLQELASAVRKEKLALSTSIEKADSWSFQGEELTLNFRAEDRFSGEHVVNEKETILKFAGSVFAPPAPTRLKIVFMEPSAPKKAVHEQAAMVKSIFRGEIIKGE